jgi:hypothetical protein
MDQDRVIGYLVDGKFVCPECVSRWRKDVSVYKVNIGIYSQACSVCKKIIVKSAMSRLGGPLELFPS